MHTNVILTNKRRTHAQSNYTNYQYKTKASYAIRPGKEWAYSTPLDKHGSSNAKWNPESMQLRKRKLSASDVWQSR